jgi:chromate transport protein ChrA
MDGFEAFSKERMRKRFFARLACTGIASPLLMLLAYEMGGTGFAWLAAPLYAPGLMIAPLVARMAGQAGNLEIDLQIAFGLNFVFIWIALLLVLNLVERLVARFRAKAAH